MSLLACLSRLVGMVLHILAIALEQFSEDLGEPWPDIPKDRRVHYSTCFEFRRTSTAPGT